MRHLISQPMLEDVVTEKGLPQNLEAERSVLGAVLLDPNALSFVVPILTADDFFPDTHRRIYRSMLELSQRSAEIDILTLKEEFSRTGTVERVGGAAYLSSLLDAVPDVANVEHYARIVKEKSTLRRLIQAGQKLVREGLAQEKNAEILLGDATGEIFDIAEDSVRGGFTSIGQIVKHNLDIIEDARNRQGMLSGLPTGFTGLDRMTSGLQSSDLIIVAARPSVGKTSFALNIAQHVAIREGRSVGFFSLEMSKEQLGFRVLCSEADVDAKKVRDGYASKEAMQRLVLAQTKVHGANFFLDDSASLSVPEMRAKGQRLKREKGLDLLVVDYMQLMMGHGRFDNRTQEVSQISRGLKLLAKELRVPVIAVSQLSRQPEQRKGELRKPQLADLRDSGCLTGDTRILRSDTGQEVTIRELFESGARDIPVWTLDESLKLVAGNMTRAFQSGTKPVFGLRLASGRTLRASGNHPFLTLEGWRPLERLTAGDRLATPRRVSEPGSRVEWPEARIVLLAHLLGDGCFVARQPLHYTSADPSNLDAVDEAARHFGVVPRRVAQKNWWHLYLPAPFRLARGRRNPIALWLDGFGLYGKRSYEKFIPAEVAGLSKVQLALFLKHLWATDGCLFVDDRQSRIYYASTSRRMIDDLHSLLLRFGIVGRIKETRKGGHRPCYQLHVTGAENQRTFVEKIGGFGQRAMRARMISESLASVVANTNVDTVPVEVWGSVRAAMRRKGV
ncbi:MAG TPA: replicative DNA helicase, partial [Thermoanaerobaculia bacterium]|nr:replicative DNA helicase [Thermoanaerobaculia bacterium]